MTNHAVLAGSVLVGVALWAAVYTALLPKHAPALPNAREVSAVRSVGPADLEQEAPGPRRWADLPRQEPKPSIVSPANVQAPSATDLPDVRQPRDHHRTLRRFHQIRRAALPDVFIEHRFVRERAYAPRRDRARMRFRRIQEPIQFSLATRSSS